MIRWLGADDLAQWREVRSEGIRLNPTAFLTTLDEFLAESDASVLAKLSKGHLLGAFESDRLMGVAGYGRKTGKLQTRHRAEISAVYFRPAARGTGLAVRLMEYLESYARAQGVTQLELYVEVRNANAQRFYEKLGYERFGTLPNAVVIDGEAYDDLFMVRALDR